MTETIIDKKINDTIRQYYYPHLISLNNLNEDTSDTRSVNFQINKGLKFKQALIGNSRKDWIPTYNNLHTPLLNYYENIEWWDRNNEHDFDEYLKK